MRFVTADREFIGFDWIHWLLKEQIPFCIRIKACEYLAYHDGREQKAKDWFAVRACRCKPQKMEIWGLPVYVGGKHLHEKEYLVVISNQTGDLLADYRLRWKIETLFQALKGRGFDLGRHGFAVMESCRLSKEKRLSGWFGFLALGLCWCLSVGQSVDEETPLPLKKHGRRSVSIFQRGFRHLQLLVACLAGRPNEQKFQQAIRHLCPQK